MSNVEVFSENLSNPSITHEEIMKLYENYGDKYDEVSLLFSFL